MCLPDQVWDVTPLNMGMMSSVLLGRLFECVWMKVTLNLAYVDLVM